MVKLNNIVIPEFINKARMEAFGQPLLNKYLFEMVTEEELWNVNWLEDFAFIPNELYLDKDKLCSDKQKEKLKQLEAITSGAMKLQDSLLIKDSNSNQIIGLFNGYKQNDDSYYMQLTAIHKNYRRLGLYSALIDRVIQYTKYLGYNRITSCHSPVNNAVLIAKLKKDFKILSMEIDALLGINIWLCYFHNKEMQIAHEMRCGHISFSKKMYESSHGTAEQLLNVLQSARI
jgi:ribosomal protein S18 acetylase RimI-like enzyme